MKQRIFSGIQPSGNLHIGNYLGAIKQWTALQDAYESLFCIVDLHAITVPQDPETLRVRTLEIAKIYLAAGIDPKKSALFVQSHVHEHTELCWILNSVVAKVGDLTKMTQLKDKAKLVDDELILRNFDEFSRMESSGEVRGATEKMSPSEAAKIAKFAVSQTLLKFLKERYINPLNATGVGLFDYPVLMAADILLYDTALVPVGEDQVQHVELARTLARRFNKRFGETFVVPESKVQKEGARIMGLDNPEKKMSKSASSEYNFVALMDDPELARKKIMKAVTDSGNEIVYRDDRPAIKNLINIFSLLNGISTDDVISRFVGRSYSDFKKALGDVVVEFLTDFQGKFHALSNEETLRILRDGADRARAIAEEKMKCVRERTGFLL